MPAGGQDWLVDHDDLTEHLRVRWQIAIAVALAQWLVGVVAAKQAVMRSAKRAYQLLPDVAPADGGREPPAVPVHWGGG